MSYKNILISSILLLALGLRLIGGDTANFSYLILALYALRGRTQTIEALALLCLFSFVNPSIATYATKASIFRYFVIGLAAISVFLLNSNVYRSTSAYVNRSIFATVALFLFLLLHSIFVSEVPDVSILKTISWGLVTLTLLAAWGGLSYQERVHLQVRLFCGIGSVILVSTPLVFTNIGYINNGIGFQGVLDQAQAFGLVAAIMSSWLIGRLFKPVKHRWLEVIFLGICLVLLLMSEARTAGFALVFAVLCSVLIFFPPIRVTTKFLKRIIIFLSVATIVVITWSDRLEAFIFKRDNQDTLIMTAIQSRGILVEPMIENIAKDPLFGIGFGVASDPSSMLVDRNNILSIPSAAPTEKGVLPIAVLEEVGTIGLIVVLIWLWGVIIRSVHAGFNVSLITLTVLFTNLGEASLFSAGGMGLLFLILLTWAVTNPSNICLNSGKNSKLNTEYGKNSY